MWHCWASGMRAGGHLPGALVSSPWGPKASWFWGEGRAMALYDPLVALHWRWPVLGGTVDPAKQPDATSLSITLSVSLGAM